MEEILEQLEEGFGKDEEIAKLYQVLFAKRGKKFTPLEMIANYEENQDLFEDRDFDLGTEVYKQVMRITAEYANALKYNGNVKKSVPYLNKAIFLFDNNSKFAGKSPDENYRHQLYEVMKLNRGLAFYRLGKNKFAWEDFNNLAKNFPDNIEYQKSLWRATSARLNKACSVFFLIVIILVLVKTFFGKQLSDFNYYLLVGIGVVSGAIVIVISVLSFFLKKKIDKDL